MVLFVIYAALPVLCWAVMARTLDIGVPVGLALLIGAVTVSGHSLGLWTFRGAPECYLWYGLLGGPLIVGAVYAERRLLSGPRAEPRPRRVSVATVVFGIHFGGVALLAVPAWALMFGQAGGAYGAPPDLPPGFSLSAGSPEGCGSSVCTRSWEVRSEAALPAEEIVRRLAVVKEPCRPNGWVLDRRPRCLTIDSLDGRVRLSISIADNDLALPR
ncbi:hypothetical protein ACIRBX_25565 [Kitasatospora sp. NPDC096147]|uniref:hypothetical protein n=1 Tax=Kitasatospora sp. NPDC096147 TaxID=3364093 RepID=UPI003811427D